MANSDSSAQRYAPATGAFDPQLNVLALLPDPTSTNAEIVSEGRRIGYHELRERIHRLGSALSRCGVGAGTTVAVMGWDDHRYLESYFAVPGIGAILQTVNVRLSPDQIAYTLRDSGARILIYHPDFMPLVERLTDDLGRFDALIVMGDADALTSTAYDAMLADADPAFDFPDIDERAVASTFHTTGTVGTPKGVSFTHRQLVLHTLTLAATLANQPTGEGLRRGDVYMPLTPMFHVHAWGLPYVATMLGIGQVYPGRYDPAAIVALKDREGVTFSHCVPTILDMILGVLGDRVVDRWTMVIGGSALSAPLAARAARAGITTVAGFGMSETGPVVALARSHGGDPDDRRRAGFPLPLVDARIADDGDGDGTGELLLRAPWLTQGYAGQPDQGAALWRGGWLHTGDVARMTDAGEIEIVDRMKDVIKSGGEWISSPDIEGLATEHPDVAAAALIAAVDARWGERPILFAVPADPGRPLPDLKSHLSAHAASGRISRYAIPDRVIAIDTLPLTSVGKIDKKRLRAQLETAGGLSA